MELSPLLEQLKRTLKKDIPSDRKRCYIIPDYVGDVTIEDIENLLCRTNPSIQRIYVTNKVKKLKIQDVSAFSNMIDGIVFHPHKRKPMLYTYGHLWVDEDVLPAEKESMSSFIVFVVIIVFLYYIFNVKTAV